MNTEFMRILLLISTLVFFGCTNAQQKPHDYKKVEKTYQGKTAKALFAGGCFWCMEPPFDKLDGVLSTTSGFAGGKEVNPAYKQVASGKTGHVEAVLILFDPTKVDFRKLVDVYWRQVDPTDSGGQFVDRGQQYRPVLFYYDDQQKKDIADSQAALEKLKKYDKPITVEILPYSSFYPAEEYHQNYYQNNPLRYKYYRNGSGRDKYLRKIWGKKK